MPPRKDEHEINIGIISSDVKVRTSRVATDRAMGPFAENKFSETGLMVNQFRVILKGSTGKWHKIVNLLSPEGGSVNNSIDPEIRMLTLLCEGGRCSYRAGQTGQQLMNGEAAYKKYLPDSFKASTGLVVTCT